MRHRAGGRAKSHREVVRARAADGARVKGFEAGAECLPESGDAEMCSGACALPGAGAGGGRRLCNLGAVNGEPLLVYRRVERIIRIVYGECN